MWRPLFFLEKVWQNIPHRVPFRECPLTVLLDQKNSRTDPSTRVKRNDEASQGGEPADKIPKTGPPGFSSSSSSGAMAMSLNSMIERDSERAEDMNILPKMLMGCDATELYSPVRLGQVCEKYKMKVGTAFDLRAGYDLSCVAT